MVVTPERLVAERQDAAEEIGRRATISLSSERDLGTNAGRRRTRRLSGQRL
jgi:hypothetical protein